MANNLKELIDKLYRTANLSDSEFISILEGNDSEADSYLYSQADQKRRIRYGTDVYLRGLIEFSNYCKNHCFYCGISAEVTDCDRYRLSEEEIMSCCENGYALGFRTFVLQGGEDPFFTTDKICQIVAKIHAKYPDCAITLSIGEKSFDDYKRFYDAGASRYLLRHETADQTHYSKLHPSSMTLENRKECLYNLKKIGFQTGAGLMVGSPYQTTENLISDIRFLQELSPQMVGIGPFIPHESTRFKDFEKGTLRDTLVMVAITRLILPNALIPSTTALGTISDIGRELGLKAGANVVMPNLSPVKFRKLYSLYDDKICTGEEAAECKGCLERRVESAGYKIVSSKGDFLEE